MIEAASGYAHVIMMANYDAKNPTALKQLVAAGAKLHRFPKDVMDAAFKEANALYAELSAKNPRWKKILPDDFVSSTPSRTCGTASPRPVSTTSCSRRSSKEPSAAHKNPRAAQAARGFLFLPGGPRKYGPVRVTYFFLFFLASCSSDLLTASIGSSSATGPSAFFGTALSSDRSGTRACCGSASGAVP